MDFYCLHTAQFIKEQRRVFSISFGEVDGLIQNALADIKHEGAALILHKTSPQVYISPC